jgi:hypothetical protein
VPHPAVQMYMYRLFLMHGKIFAHFHLFEEIFPRILARTVGEKMLDRAKTLDHYTQSCRTRRPNYSTSTSTSFSSFRKPSTRSSTRFSYSQKPRRHRVRVLALLENPRRDRVLDQLIEYFEAVLKKFI